MAVIHPHNYTTANCVSFLHYIKFTHYKNHSFEAFEKKILHHHVQARRRQQLLQHHLLCDYKFRSYKPMHFHKLDFLLTCLLH